MLGGAWYNEYIGNKTETQIYEMAVNELKKHLNNQVNPDLYELSILKVNLIQFKMFNLYILFVKNFKNCIPQYRVGHQKLLKEIKECLVEYKLEDKLYLNGFTYDGIGLNDTIFNSRKLVQNSLSNHKLIINKN